MKLAEKIEYLLENHPTEWRQAWQLNEEGLSQAQPMFCVCGRLATGLHERTCRRFQKKVDSVTAKSLQHLIVQKVN